MVVNVVMIMQSLSLKFQDKTVAELVLFLKILCGVCFPKIITNFRVKILFCNSQNKI